MLDVVGGDVDAMVRDPKSGRVYELVRRTIGPRWWLTGWQPWCTGEQSDIYITLSALLRAYGLGPENYWQLYSHLGGADRDLLKVAHIFRDEAGRWQVAVPGCMFGRPLRPHDPWQPRCAPLNDAHAQELRQLTSDGVAPVGTPQL